MEEAGMDHEQQQQGLPQGPEDQKGWDLPGLFATLQELFVEGDGGSSSNSSSGGYIHRAVLLLGRSYALPCPMDAAVRLALRPLLDSERFFLDVLYIHAAEESGAGPRHRRVLPRKERAVGAKKVKQEKEKEKEKEGEEGGGVMVVEVVDVGDDSDVEVDGEKEKEEEEEEGAAMGAAEEEPPLLVPLPPVRAQAIWEALTEFGERHPWKAQGDFFFDATHGPRGTAHLLVKAQMLLAHPVQRDSQVE